MEVLMLALLRANGATPQKEALLAGPCCSLPGGSRRRSLQPLLPHQDSLLLWAGGFYLIAQLNHPKERQI